MPHLRNYRHWVKRALDIGRFNEMAAVLVGEHDFTCFAAEGDANLSKVRRIVTSVFHWDSDTLVYTIAATSFLWKMVRTIMGTFLMLDEQGQGARELALIMEAGMRANAGGTAPARGLFLERVDYDDKETVPEHSVEDAQPAGRLAGGRVFP
jgi:tRNA pseudouridine38-40 synthase